MWLYDAPSGVYKNHALSSQIREQVPRDAVFARYLEQERGYGKGKGASVTVTQVLQLPPAGRIAEQDSVPTGRAVIQTVQTAVSEWGFAIELTELEENLTHFDLRNKQQRMLRDQMKLTVDKMAADALKTSPVIGIPTSAAALTFDTDGTPSSTAASNLRIAHLRQAHDYFRQTLVAPTFSNGMYIGILSTRAARGIKSDPEYKDWFAPTTSQPFETGRLKDVEGFALFESNHQNALDDTIGTAGVCGQALLFGADAGFFATVMDPELRAGLTTDLGRKRLVGWVATMEAGLTWRNASQARVIRIDSDV